MDFAIFLESHSTRNKLEARF